MLDQEDEGTRIGVWVIMGVLFLVISGVLGGVVMRQTHKSAVATALAAATAEPAVVVAEEMLIDGPTAGELLGTLFFEVGSADLPADAATAVAAVTKALADAPARKLVLSGFHDASGDAALNAELAKKRAIAVRNALTSAGADAARVGLRKPESTTGDGNAQEARRVELRLVE